MIEIAQSKKNYSPLHSNFQKSLILILKIPLHYIFPQSYPSTKKSAKTCQTTLDFESQSAYFANSATINQPPQRQKINGATSQPRQPPLNLCCAAARKSESAGARRRRNPRPRGPASFFGWTVKARARSARRLIDRPAREALGFQRRAHLPDFLRKSGAFTAGARSPAATALTHRRTRARREESADPRSDPGFSADGLIGPGCWARGAGRNDRPLSNG